MPWLETDPMNERKRFILEATGGLFSHTELCLRHGVSRKTGYKWIERYESEGPDGLGDRPHRVRAHPHTTEPHVVDAALELRGQRRRWGTDKIRARLLTLHPDWSVPSARILHYLLACQGLEGTTYSASRRVFTRLFREFGLPTRIRTDNGTPFASIALGRLSRLSVCVDQARHPARPHRARLTPTERPPRTHAQRPQGRRHHPTCWKPFRSAEALQLLPYRLQPDPSSRSPRPEAACFRLSTLEPLVPLEAEHTRLSCSLRSPQSLNQWRNPMALRLDQRLSPARWRLHRSRRDRPRHLGRLLWPRLARLAALKKKSHSRPR